MSDLFFIAANDLSNAADEALANQITNLDLGEIFADKSSSASFRLGNDGGSIDYSFTLLKDNLNDFDFSYVELPQGGSIGEGGTTDTLVLTITGYPDAGNRLWVLTLRVDGGSGTSDLLLSFATVGSRQDRESEFPSRFTSQTAVFSDQILRSTEPIKLLRFDPIPYNSTDSTVIVESKPRNLENGSFRFITQNDPCERLNPNNHLWGYSLSEIWIRGSFQPEVDEVTTSFTHRNNVISYQSTASLILPAEFHSDLQRLWALFTPANASEDASYKRTVFIFERNDEYWTLQDLVLPPLGDIATFIETRLIQIHNAATNSPMFYNPFSLIYPIDSDKPIASFPCKFQLAIETVSDTSNASNSSSNSS